MRAACQSAFKADAFDYIERFYNAVRGHSTIRCFDPVEFERKGEFAQSPFHETGGGSVCHSAVERRIDVRGAGSTHARKHRRAWESAAPAADRAGTSPSFA